MKKCGSRALGAMGIVLLVGFANRMVNPEVPFNVNFFIGITLASVVAYFLVCLLIREQ
ncbi:MAG: hypothetical protein PHH24_04070 [Candidatus Moranbacteria bacterium]|jgi:hypothetical protein|nr:hypothetical protein [Candidatus Moranbacteria bacterium]MDD5652140.1 hypothetical protein [Candidatus Moranbacteria bacterium]MDX9856067.1 hypothetical protein [Candidatus Moranbacteria bacterium]